MRYLKDFPLNCVSIAVCSVFGCSINNACATTMATYEDVLIPSGDHKDKKNEAAFIFKNVTVNGRIEGSSPLTFQRALLQLKQNVQVLGDIKVNGAVGGCMLLTSRVQAHLILFH